MHVEGFGRYAWLQKSFISGGTAKLPVPLAPERALLEKSDEIKLSLSL